MSSGMGNYLLARDKFYRASKYPQESIQEWLQRLNGLLENCAFKNYKNEVFQDLFIIGLGPGFVQDKLLQRINEDPNVQLGTLVKLAIEAEKRNITVHMYATEKVSGYEDQRDDINEILKGLDIKDSKCQSCSESRTQDNRCNHNKPDCGRKSFEDAHAKPAITIDRDKFYITATESSTSEKCCACTDCNR